MTWDITNNKILYSPIKDTPSGVGNPRVLTSSNNEDIFTTYNKSKTSPYTENYQTNQTKYWDAVMQVHPYRDEIYSEITKLTGSNEYNNFPPEAKAIADKMNDFCNSMTAGKMASAMQSSNIEDELKSLLDEVKNYRDECMNELRQLYSKDKSDNTTSLNQFEQQNNPFST